MWTDERPELVQRAYEDFKGWVAAKSDGELAVPEVGIAEGFTYTRHRSAAGWATEQCPAELRVERAAGHEDVADVLRANLTETRADGSRWSTTLRAWTGA